ncbi:MAG TPA: molybdenum cofactor guanylyltransferase [Deltaproteobacteria bacterium]|jgi:molybdopterin-guanine dinucleotide biosynthesis protein A|nr:molybdenum cofactor guanylyltransferase [Deltaproteobacteria bacterium]HRW80149.1 molybdenum cofactor guanylyltransferase [Desulfomonilia bacterium]NMD40462.1 molybdenum cofactor guanylyltransferase [Deltaproteobacteria bacterium]HNQ84490.1 molybdenum cofactor guanylyltransferase [Deltaproteobacteria bacterium]HNS88901.1 molybdenum cofactor guanylyltransferase [Deltaproteobacteria bacterium]
MTGVVLVGGKSRRFGRDKVLSEFKGTPLLDHVVGVLRPLFDEVILVGHRRKGLERHRVFEDIRPGCGPLGGIYTALHATSAEHCFVCAADMPHMNPGFISHMTSLADDHDIILPVWSKGREPLHAVYRRTVLPLVEELLAKGCFKIFSLVEQVDTLFIPEDAIRRYGDPAVMFSNINTLHDMERMIS